MAPSPLPVANSTTSFWRTTPHKLDNYRSTEQLPEEADIVIVGAGYAGASIAHHVLQETRHQTKKPNIVILEAREACSGATGRNGGHLKPDPYVRAATALDKYDVKAAEEVASFEARHVDEIAQLIEQEGFECDFVRTRAVDVPLYEQGAKDIQAKIDKLRAAGLSGIGDVYCASSTQAEQASGIKGARGCFTYTAGSIWPYKLVLSLLSKAVSEGVNLQTHTPVTSITPNKNTRSSHSWLLQTPHGPIRTSKVIYTTNAYSSHLLPEYQKHIVPVRGLCSRITCPNPNTGPVITNTYILRFNDWEYDYLIPRNDGSIIVGGARRDFYKDLDSWFGNADDSQLIESTRNYFDGYMQRHFRGWENSGARTDRVWTGIMGYTSDGFPHVGPVPNKSGQYICAGFSGHGMPQVFLSAKALARMIVDEKAAADVDLPGVYWTSKARLESEEEHVTMKAWRAVFGTGVDAKAKL